MRYLYVFVLLLISTVTFSQEGQKASKKVTRYLDEVCSIVKKRALYADSINWNDLEARLARLSAGMNGVEECRPLLDTIRKALYRAGDHHSFFLSKEEVKQSGNSASAGIPPEGKYIGDGIGYLRVPMFATFDVKACSNFAEKVQDQIKLLEEGQPIKAWVIDLRNNRGGNIFPMIKGLSSIIGNDVCGYTLYTDREVPLSPKSGFAKKLDIPDYQAKCSTCRMAILIDSMTGSSGEFLTMVLKGLPGARTFGKPTGGATTSNEAIKLSDGSYLLLATAYMADRNRKKYIPNISPDVFTLTKDKDHDYTLDAATAWLKESN
jgi:carboxyl-terminal processing protease